MSHAVPRITLPRGWPARIKSGLLHAIALARVAVTHAHAACASSRIARVRLAGRIDQLQSEVALLREEMRIKDTRWHAVPAPERPHYAPTERLAILELQAARGWCAEVLAEKFFVTAATIASWHQRIDEQGPDALVKTPKPVNRYPDFVATLVKKLTVTLPAIGQDPHCPDARAGRASHERGHRGAHAPATAHRAT
jgi:hypothetical protein